MLQDSGCSSIAGVVREDGGARRRREQSWRVSIWSRRVAQLSRRGA
ncbi:hypothetical protein A2U01_0099152, partial [Trifolium medium]|nr:hypothetical protein [Trifolium medium]